MRKLAFTLVPLILLRSTSVFALGVGDIELHSALNQPLNAEIRLLSATPAELQGLTVALAPEAAFISAGVDRLGLLNQLRFKVIQKSDGSHVIQVTSSQPIREPFLDFLVEVNWPTGRFVREYTVLLDFPVLEGGKPAPIDAPTVTASPEKSSEGESTPDVNTTSGTESSTDNTHTESATETAAPPATATRGKSPRQAPLQTAVAGDGSYGPTQRADTLWDIALKMRPDSSVSVSQVMLALAKNNPQAFFGNNVNNLMAGYILRLPPVDEIRAIPQEDAIREVAGQYQQWLNVQRGGMAVPSAPDSAANAEMEGTPPMGKGASGAQLKLATPDSDKTGVSGGTGRKLSGDTSDVAALRKELAMALEAVDANRQENAELRSRMAQLEQQLTSMQRLLELKDGNMAALQNKKAANTPAATSQPAATASPSTTGSPPPPPRAPVVTPAEPPAEDLLGTLMGDQKQLGLLIGGFLVISALVWAMVRRRRQSAIDSADESFAKLLKNSTVTDEGKKDDETSSPAIANNVKNNVTEQDLPSTVMALSSAQTDEDMIDPLAEADVYLAYKRYDQAAELIKDAIRNDPTRPDLSLKLLEVYHLAKNNDAFETQAETLYAELNGDSNHPLWAKAIEMGKQTAPTHPLFFKAVATVAAAGTAASLGFMADAPAPLDAMTGNADVAPSELAPETPDNSFSLPNVEQPKTVVTDNSIDFNLDASPPADLAIEDSAPAETDAPLSNSMDFDLSLNDAIDTPIDTLGITDNDAPPPPATESLAQGTASLSNEMDLDYASVHNTPEGHEHGNGYDNQAAAPETSASDFNLDDPAIAAFDGTAPDDAMVSAEKENDLFSGIDMVGTKLDLAKAYIDMEDKEGARMLLNEVLEEGSAPQKSEARELMQQIT